MHHAMIRFREYMNRMGNPDRKMLLCMDEPEMCGLWDWMSEYIELGKLQSYLEIGSNCGVSLWMMAPFCNRKAYITAVDLMNGQSGQPELLQKVAAMVDAKIIKGDSREVHTQIDGQFDMILIDGDHTYEGVKADWDNYFPKLKSGGIICLHDTFAKSFGVKQLWEERRGGLLFSDNFGVKQGVGIGVKR
jgi:predicted O-methyltransferase YrrM